MTTELTALESFLLSRPKEKTAAGLSNLGEHMQEAAMSGLATGMVGAGLAGVSMAASHIYDAMTKQRDFRSMLHHNADVAEAHQANPKQVNLFFSTLRNMNPEFSKDPVVAGAYLRRMLNSEEHAGGIAVEALSSRKSFPTSPLEEGFSAGGMKGMEAGLKRPTNAEQNDAFKRKLLEHGATKVVDMGLKGFESAATGGARNALEAWQQSRQGPSPAVRPFRRQGASPWAGLGSTLRQPPGPNNPTWNPNAPTGYPGP